MYYILQEFQENLDCQTKKLIVDGQEVVVTRNAMYGKNFVYLLPQENGTFLLNKIEFVRNDKRVMVGPSDEGY